MWEKNDKSGDRTINQEAVQPSGGQPSGGGMLPAGSMVQEESREWDGNKGEMRNHGKHLGPNFSSWMVTVPFWCGNG